MADNVKGQLVSKVRDSCYYALQLDESTDTANQANIIVFVRYENNETIHEDLLLCKSLHTRTTANAIFDLLNAFIKEKNID